MWPFGIGFPRTSLVVQWLRLCAFTAGDTSLIPGQGTKISHATRPKGKKKWLPHPHWQQSVRLYLRGFLQSEETVMASPEAIAKEDSADSLHNSTLSASRPMKVKVSVAQSYLSLCDPMDCSLPGPSVHGILQAEILEWVAIPFSRGSSQPKD